MSRAIFYGLVAKSVEHSPKNLKVPGSIPILANTAYELHVRHFDLCDNSSVRCQWEWHTPIMKDFRTLLPMTRDRVLILQLIPILC